MKRKERCQRWVEEQRLVVLWKWHNPHVAFVCDVHQNLDRSIRASYWNGNWAYNFICVRLLRKENVGLFIMGSCWYCQRYNLVGYVCISSFGIIRLPLVCIIRCASGRLFDSLSLFFIFYCVYVYLESVFTHTHIIHVNKNVYAVHRPRTVYGLVSVRHSYMILNTHSSESVSAPIGWALSLKMRTTLVTTMATIVHQTSPDSYIYSINYILIYSESCIYAATTMHCESSSVFVVQLFVNYYLLCGLCVLLWCIMSAHEWISRRFRHHAEL